MSRVRICDADKVVRHRLLPPVSQVTGLRQQCSLINVVFLCRFSHYCVTGWEILYELVIICLVKVPKYSLNNIISIGINVFCDCLYDTQTQTHTRVHTHTHTHKQTHTHAHILALLITCYGSKTQI